MSAEEKREMTHVITVPIDFSTLIPARMPSAMQKRESGEAKESSLTTKWG